MVHSAWSSRSNARPRALGSPGMAPEKALSLLGKDGPAGNQHDNVQNHFALTLLHCQQQVIQYKYCCASPESDSRLAARRCQTFDLLQSEDSSVEPQVPPLGRCGPRARIACARVARSGFARHDVNATSSRRAISYEGIAMYNQAKIAFERGVVTHQKASAHCVASSPHCASQGCDNAASP
jgi:hypothetical protein